MEEIFPIEVSLIDDVVFSGNMICKVAEALREKNIVVREVLSAIAVQENIDVITSRGIDVKSSFYITNVLDEVCERDFYFGIAQSGQNELQPNGIVLKKPYFSPFGNAEDSASVPTEKVTDFSKECLGCSYELWSDIRNKSGREVTSQDLPEKIFNTPYEQNFEVLPLLQQSMQSLEQ